MRKKVKGILLGGRISMDITSVDLCLIIIIEAVWKKR